jgi:ABC-type proline/glycine betaine transport system ATPase subunit
VAYVTHDVAEAFALGDGVAVLRDGAVVQHGPPDELWAAPADGWTARFLGLGNVRDGRVIRPEAVHVRPGSGAVVLATTRLGAVVRLRVRLDSGEELDAATTALDHPAAGDRVAVEVDPAGVIELPTA